VNVSTVLAVVFLVLGLSRLAGEPAFGFAEATIDDL